MFQWFETINQNCRLATRLVSAAHDRALSRLERCGLSLHLIGCRSCRRYRKQINLLEQLNRQVAEHPQNQTQLPPEARRRIDLQIRQTSG